MELGLSLGKAAGPEAARTTPELGLGLGVGAGSGRRVEGGGGSTVAAGGRWWATAPAVSPEPAVRLSLVSTLGLQWPPSESAQPRAFCSFLGDAAGRPEPLPARGFDVNRAPSVSAASAARLDEDEDNDERALSSSPNDGAEGGAAPAAGGERSSSRASDEDEGASARKKLRLSKEQSAFLEESFRENNTLNTKQKAALARQLNLRPRQVEVWFQNRRARTKLKQTEVDCEYLKRCCETLTAENRRLHKELAELRALKTAQPFYTHLPATTLSMCPSCERVASNPASTSAAPASLSASPSPAAPTSTSTSSPAGPAPPREDRPSSFAALFAATRSFPLASQPRPPAPASNCL